MKLPFDFGIKLLFRLLLPGFILTLGLSPLINFTLDWINWPESRVYSLIAVVIVSGWLILILDMPIYMLFEGRRYWFPPFRRYFVRRETQRLENLRQKTRASVLESIESREREIEAENDQLKRTKLQQQIDLDERNYLEALFDIRNFTLDDQGNYRAKFPTRLGNLIDAFENYSSRVYGMDSVFYWPRLWLKLDKDLKEDIDSRQAVADSTVYVAFACFIDAAIWFIYSLFGSINALILNISGPIFSFKHTLFDHLPSWWFSWLIMLGFLLVAFLLYRASLRLHAQFGEVFKSVFDDFHDQITVSSVMREIANYSNDSSFMVLPQKKRFEVAWRYLQFGLIKCPHCEKRIAAAKMSEHLKTHSGS